MKLLLLISGLFYSQFCLGQDTTRVLMLVSDTSHSYYKYHEYRSCKEIGCKDTGDFHQLVIHFVERLEDRGNGGSGPAYWMYGYSVSKGLFWSMYLDDKKKPLKEGIIVWMAKYINKQIYR